MIKKAFVIGIIVAAVVGLVVYLTRDPKTKK